MCSTPLVRVFAIIGYVARKNVYHMAAILIVVLLGPLLENYFLTALKKSDGDIMVLFSSDLGNVLWAMLVISMLIPAAIGYWRKRRPAEQS